MLQGHLNAAAVLNKTVVNFNSFCYLNNYTELVIGQMLLVTLWQVCFEIICQKLKRCES